MNSELDRHVLVLTAQGRMRPPEDGTTPRDTVRQILEGFAESGRPSMTIYFHGGMTNEQTGLNLARQLHQEIFENFDSYPVFVVWKSGPLETLQSALLEISSSSPLFMQVLKKLAKWVARLLGGGAAPEFAMAEPAETSLDELLRAIELEQLPMQDGSALVALDALVAAGVQQASDVETDLLQQALADDAEADRALGIIMSTARILPSAVPGPEMATGGPLSTGSATGYLSTFVLDRLAAETPTPAEAAAAPMPGAFAGFTTARNWFFAGEVFRAIMQRFDAGTDHGFLGTILEEMYRGMYADKVGRFLWDEMKENAADAYDPIPTETTDDGIPGGTLLLEEIKAYAEQHGLFGLNLAGHSAGSIHIAHFIAAGAALMPDQFSLCNVIFTAPAINYDLFKEKVAANSDRIGNFRIFTMSDSYERLDPLVKLAPFLYPHSLLYLVSGVFEDRPDHPIVGLARHLQGVTDDAVQGFLDLFQSAAYHPIVYAVTPEGTPVGEQACFTSHYGLQGPNFDRATLNSMANQIRPAPLTELVELAATPPVQADMLEPAAAVIFDSERSAGQLPSYESENLEALSIEGDVSEPPSPGPKLEFIIGSNDIVDHALVDALIRAGRSVARIVALSVRDVAAIPPDERSLSWSQAEQAGRLEEGYGTGWILGSARRVLVTNNHVLPLPEAARTAKVEFGYERILHRGIRAAVVLRLRPDQLFLTDVNMSFGGLDYSVIALSRQASPELGYLDAVQGMTAQTARNIFIVQHPGGSGKAYVLNHNHKVNLPERYVTYISDTLEGSSGSPCFSDDGDLIALHHLGGYVANVGAKEETTNLGSRIEFVIDDIAAKLRTQTTWDEAQVAYWFGPDSSVLRAWKRLSKG